MLTDEQKYMFDVQGYAVVKNAIDPSALERMRKDMQARGVKNPENHAGSRFSDFLHWGPDWRALIDLPAVYSYLEELIEPKFRLDHAYGMQMRAGGKEYTGPEMHHQANMYEHGCFYTCDGRKMHNGLIVVSYALSDIPEGAGGFICIPGSHKAAFAIPGRFHWMKDNPMWRQVPQQAGDALIFTEALTHGTMPWKLPGVDRLSVLMKYCPLYMQWSAKPMNADIAGLSERQKRILTGAYVWERPRLD